MPEGVRLDPELRVWRVLDREQLPPILRQWIIARAPRLAQASTAEDVREAARALAKRFFETPPQAVPRDALNQGSEPVLLVGLHADVDAALARAGLPRPPRKPVRARQRTGVDRRARGGRAGGRDLGGGCRRPAGAASARCRTTARRAGWCSTAGACSTAACGRRPGG